MKESESIMKDKRQLREKCKELRANIACREQKEKAIADKLFYLYPSVRSVFCYESFGSEASTKDIIARYILLGAKVCVPKVLGANMVTVDVTTREECSREIDLIIVPLLAFDGECNRLGYGKGYYDRYLRGKNITSVGIAFSEQEQDIVPHNEFDVPLAVIITERGIIYRNIR